LHSYKQPCSWIILRNKGNENTVEINVRWKNERKREVNLGSKKKKKILLKRGTKKERKVTVII